MSLQVDPSNLVMYLPLDDLADGAASNGLTFGDLSGNGNDGTGDDGTNNTGLTAKAEVVLSYANFSQYINFSGVAAPAAALAQVIINII